MTAQELAAFASLAVAAVFLVWRFRAPQRRRRRRRPLMRSGGTVHLPIVDR